MMKTLSRIFKAIKYARKLDLRKLELVNGSISRSYAIDFTKRMHRAQIVLLQDKRLQKLNFQGVTESWVKYTKGADRFSYSLVMDPIEETSQKKLSKTAWKFLRFLGYQPRLKDLALSFALPPPDRPNYGYRKPSAVQDLNLLQRCSKNIQRLSIQGICSINPIINSLNHFPNLKHLDLEFNSECPPETITCFIRLLPSHLQSLSLDWLDNFPSDMPFLKHLTCLSKLKIKSRGKYTYFSSREKAIQRFQPFSSCPIKDFSLEASISGQEEFDQIAKFLKNTPDLERLKLKLECSWYNHSISKLPDLLQIIDDLALLRSVSVSMTTDRSSSKTPEVIFAFPKLFNKPVPLESFKISVPPIKSSDNSFLELLEALRPLVANLKKLRIDIGDFGKDKKNEPETILSFIQSLENIQCLRLDSLKISKVKFFLELLEVVEKMPNLRTLTLGKVSETITKPKFLSLVERVLQKKGLEAFDCQVIKKFQNILEKEDKEHPFINIDKISKINRVLKVIPEIGIFAWKDDKQWKVPKE